MPAHLDLLAEPAEAAILGGDPRRVFHLAQELIEEPRMTHLARGLWGYGGRVATGQDLTVQSTGVGGPSAVTVLSGLAERGVGRVVRVGSCVAEAPELKLGDHLIVEKALARDGSQAFFPGVEDSGQDGLPWSLPDRELTESLAGDETPVPVASHYRTEQPGREEGSGVRAHDLQTAALLASASELGLRTAAILVVAETSTGLRGSEQELQEAFLRAGRRALRTLYPAA